MLFSQGINLLPFHRELGNGMMAISNKKTESKSKWEQCEDKGKIGSLAVLGWGWLPIALLVNMCCWGRRWEEKQAGFSYYV
jgi:hypothetical protein